MRALVLEANSKLHATDIQVPSIDGDDMVLLRVAACGICGSDIPRAFDNGAYRYPLVMGHEFAGTVAASSGRFATGDRVTVFPLIPCGRCPACSVGAYAQCDDYDYLGSRSDGGFAEYVAVPEANLIPVPDELDVRHAALTEPVAVALHGVRRLDVEPGDKAVVFGGGPIGLLAALWLRVAGCLEVYVVDIDARKLAIAGNYGFIPIDGSNADPVESIRRRSGGITCAIEACGLAVTYRQCLEVVDAFGRVVLMGNIKGSLTLSQTEVSSILRREITIRGTWNSSVVPRDRNEWTTSLSYMSKTFDLEPIISHVIPISEAPGFMARMHDRDVWHMRVLATPESPS